MNTPDPLPCTGPRPCARRSVTVGMPPDAAHAALSAVLRETHGVVIGRCGPPTPGPDGGLHAEYRVAFGLFVDDVDAHFAPSGAGTVVTLRSTSRVGRSDLGVNARRLGALERALVARAG